MQFLQWRLHAENKFIHLLAILLILFILSPFVEEIDSAFPFTSLIFLLALTFTLRTLNLNRKIFLSYVLLGVVLLFLELRLRTQATIIPAKTLGIAAMSIFSIFLLISIIAIIHRAFAASKVTMDTIFGGICVYLLIGYFFATLYYIIFFFDKDAFVFSSRWNDIYLFYFSFTTMTTLGYGDVYPVNKTAMVLSNLEAVAGQIYLGIFVARLVGLHIIHQANSK